MAIFSRPYIIITNILHLPIHYMHRIVTQINKGFTLLEIMAALLVVAILATIAIPSYREYQTRAMMVDVINTLESYLAEAKKEYVGSNVVPAAVYDLNSGVLTAYTKSKYIDYLYYNDGSTWTNSGKAAMVQAVLSREAGGGITGFVAGSSGASSRVTLAFLATEELLKQYCGSWANDGSQVPLTYLPAGCQDAAFNTVVTGD